MTREIVKAEDSVGLIWRISLANVDVDGPFSTFDGLTRILTVISGVGIDLISPRGVIAAGWGDPVRFSGNLPIKGRLIQGPIRDLNLIFDATRVSANAQVLTGPAVIIAGPGQMCCLVLAGRVQVDGLGLPDGAIALGRAGRVELDPDAKVLLLTKSDMP